MAIEYPKSCPKNYDPLATWAMMNRPEHIDGDDPLGWLMLEGMKDE